MWDWLFKTQKIEKYYGLVTYGSEVNYNTSTKEDRVYLRFLHYIHEDNVIWR
jgi:hypothetical protein